MKVEEVKELLKPLLEGILTGELPENAEDILQTIISDYEKNGKEERALYLPAKELRELLYEARKMEGCYVMFSAVDGFYTDAKDETFSEGVLGGYKGNKSVVEDLESYVDKSIKMAIYFRGCRGAKFVLATLGNDAGMYGSAKLVLEQ